MSKECSQTGMVVDLNVHLMGFIAALTKAGYAQKTKRDKKRLILPFIQWVVQTEIEVKDLDEAYVGAFLACPSRRRYGHRTALQQFLKYLRATEVVSLCAKDPSPAEVFFQKYVDHLRHRRGLSVRSVNVYSSYVRSFVAAQRLPENATNVDALAVRHYLLDHSQNRSASFVRLLAAALRSFLRFCFLDGTIAKDLSAAIPPVRRWRLATIPPFLTADEVEQVIASADRSTKGGCRAFAILLLLARLGLRAGEIVALELDNLRWETGEIIVCGKGRQHDRLPLLSDVGEALAHYLRTARGPSQSRRVFLRRIAPHVGLSQPGDVSKIARQALDNAGLLPPGRVGAHIFRHSLATRMIRNGASLTEISEVLRHRSIITTQLYAKVDLEGLRGIAPPWPGTEVPR